MIAIRRLATLQEMHACEQLQKAAWQFSDVEIVPHTVFVVADKTGGEGLGAFDGDHIVGFALAFPAVHAGRFCLHSHMTAVLPECQNAGVGRRLKLAQRENAMGRGVEMIEWTFDPLQLRNAHFNIARLGAVVRRYLPNLYGRTSSNLDAGLPTDRLVAEWWLASRVVQDTLERGGRKISATHECIAIPANISAIRGSDPQQAMEIQSRVRSEFQTLLQNSYAVTGFILDEQSGTYLLEPYEE
ncbi:MAG: GNAT family N-acetyltransferase [Acidobacteriaceae bacterium]